MAKETEAYINVIAIESEVKIGGCKIDAKVIGIKIQPFNCVTYECVWWNGNTRVVEWLNRSEVVWKDKTRPAKIGFIGAGDPSP